MLRRLAEFRSNNTTENTVLRFFDEANIHPILIDLEDVESEMPKTLDEIYDYIVAILGPPIPGFGITLEEEEEIRRLEEEERRLQEEGDRIERQVCISFGYLGIVTKVNDFKYIFMFRKFSYG